MSRKMIAVVNGYPLAGKDTVVEMLSRHLFNLGWYTDSISSVEAVKEITRHTGIPDEPKTPEKRALWAEIKAAYEKYDRYLTRGMMRHVHSVLESHPQNSIFFIHVREPESIQFIYDILEPGIEWLTIFVDRPDAERVTSNAADMGVENYVYLVRIENAGSLENLQGACDQFANLIHEGNP